ncbi:phosphotransferase system sugar-specific permease eiia type 1 [Trichococcus palustris]|jgi:sugar PTS system EIIA component|uniref:Phosphotransferase system sugar-specific permease eiia type 1 n=1 Tax=Trichococcus palustris TaxID=140314 RepID=A0A143Y4A4_9LACT|nr:PTS glucose transporter subunit IIA [Trichococcus palustris]CZQ81292.1 phosphotransferase system sugar-specific permease eiia type 1 [Trichococcus palustris]SFK62910.1 PTS system, glucose-specific IIA component [Trichococcus palustris]
MFGFLKKDKQLAEKATLFSPVNGKLVPITEVSDPVFSQKMMGDGFAVIPTDGNIYSPAQGKVLSVFPTKHAIGILLDNGVELLLHMGLDTVELNGKPFTIFVKEGQALTPDTLIAEVDLEQLKAAEKDNAMVVVITNMDKVKNYTLAVTGETAANAEIGSVATKE